MIIAYHYIIFTVSFDVGNMSECDVRIRELEVGDYDRVRDLLTSGLRELLTPIMKANMMDKATLLVNIYFNMETRACGLRSEALS